MRYLALVALLLGSCRPSEFDSLSPAVGDPSETGSSTVDANMGPADQTRGDDGGSRADAHMPPRDAQIVADAELPDAELPDATAPADARVDASDGEAEPARDAGKDADTGPEVVPDAGRDAGRDGGHDAGPLAVPITSAGPGALVLDVAGWSVTNNARVQLHPLRENDGQSVDNQRWLVHEWKRPGAETLYWLENAYARGRCLDKSYSDATVGDIDGAAVYLYDCGPTDNQLWQLRRAPGGAFQLINQWFDRRCLDIRNRDPQTGQLVWAWTCDPTSWSQRWIIPGL